MGKNTFNKNHSEGIKGYSKFAPYFINTLIINAVLITTYVRHDFLKANIITISIREVFYHIMHISYNARICEQYYCS